MYRITLLLSALWLLPLLHVQAQSSIDISISAEVQPTTIEIMTLRSMDFQGLDRTDIEINPVTSDRSGKIVALGASDNAFRISWLPERELVNMEGTGMIHFEYEVSGNPMDERENSELLDPESRELIFSDDGEYFFWVGGRVNLSQAEPGTYEGEFTIEIEYL